MPNALITTVKTLRRDRALRLAMKARNNRRFNFLKQQFPEYSLHGYGIATLGEYSQFDRVSWQMFAAGFKLYGLKPVTRYAGYNIYKASQVTEQMPVLMTYFQSVGTSPNTLICIAGERI